VKHVEQAVQTQGGILFVQANRRSLNRLILLLSVRVCPVKLGVVTAAGDIQQKGGCEVTHEMIRRVLPKGVSFDHLMQIDISIMMNHINSYTRKKLNLWHS